MLRHQICFQTIWRVLPILFFISTTGAQFRIETWTPAQGLPYKIVKSVLQTRDGYIWAATDDGLARFDGVRFTVFNTANSKGLPTNRLDLLVETADASLWMTGENHGVIRYQNGAFHNYTSKNGLPGDEIRGLTLAAPENLLCAVSQQGAACFDGEKFVAADIGYRLDESPFPYLDNKGAFWLNEGNRVRRVGKDGAQQIFPLPKNFLIQHHLNPFQDSKGNFWVAGDTTLLRFAGGETEKILPAAGLPVDYITAIYEDSHGTLWFGGRSGGLTVFKDGKFKLLTEKDGLISSDINLITGDREGGIWVGTDGGLMRFSPQIIATYSTSDGLSANNVYPILETRDGAVWIGSWLGKHGLDKYENGKFTGVRVWSSFLTSLFEDRNGTIWVGSHNYLGKIEDGKFKTVTDKPGIVVRAITQDFQGNLWFGTESGELWRIKENAEKGRKGEKEKKRDGENQTFSPSDIFTSGDGLPKGGINVLHQDRRGALWIGTTGGLAKLSEPPAAAGGLNAVSNTRPLPQAVLTTYTIKDGLSGNHIRSIYEDADGTFWFGTFDNGITRLKDGKFSAIRSENGLHDNGAFQILEDDFGRFWMSSNRGIYRVSKQELNDFAEGRILSVTSVAYGVKDGMLDAECNGGVSPAGFKSKKDGTLWFPTQKGVAVINPALLTVNNFPPNVVIEECLLDRANAVCSDIKISPENDSLEIRYTGLSFTKPEQTKFKYKLEGLDEDWVDAGTRRTAFFAHLPPGNYTFRVVAANVDGVWSETGASITLIVTPPFYRTIWFLALCAIGVGAFIAFVFNSRIKNLEKRRVAQEEFSRKLLESQESERQRIAAELHDSLGQDLLIIKNWALIGLRDGANANKQFDEISTTASQAIEEVREIAYNLRPYHLDELGLTKAVESMLERVSESSPIDFACEIDSIDGFFIKEAEINFYRIAQECVNNVVKHSEATEAGVKIKRDIAELRLSIWDNGKGFDLNSPASKRARQSGFGLAGIQERVRILGGKISINSIPNEGTNINLTVNAKN